MHHPMFVTSAAEGKSDMKNTHTGGYFIIIIMPRISMLSEDFKT